MSINRKPPRVPVLKSHDRPISTFATFRALRNASGWLYSTRNRDRGAPLLQCSFADCVNYKKGREPFYLHDPSPAAPVSGHPQPQPPRDVPGRGQVAVKDGLYVVDPAAAVVQQRQQRTAGCRVAVEPTGPQRGPFYLHSPNGTAVDPVKDIFAADTFATDKSAPPQPPAVGLNTMTGNYTVRGRFVSLW